MDIGYTRLHTGSSANTSTSVKHVYQDGDMYKIVTFVNMDPPYKITSILSPNEILRFISNNKNTFKPEALALMKKVEREIKINSIL